MRISATSGSESGWKLYWGRIPCWIFWNFCGVGQKNLQQPSRVSDLAESEINQRTTRQITWRMHLLYDTHRKYRDLLKRQRIDVFNWAIKSVVWVFFFSWFDENTKTNKVHVSYNAPIHTFNASLGVMAAQGIFCNLIYIYRNQEATKKQEVGWWMSQVYVTPIS